MIGATKAYSRMPASSPRTAAALVIRALEGRGEVVQRAEGFAMEVLRVFAPGVARQLMNVAYRVMPESAPEARTRAERPLAVLASAVVRPIWRGLR